MNLKYAFIGLIFIVASACAQHKNKGASTAASGSEPLSDQQVKKLNQQKGNYTFVRTDEEWKKMLTPESYEVMREKGTERPFANKYDKHYEKGIYKCMGCKQPLFSSEAKFDSRTGWPSFFRPVSNTSVDEIQDNDHGMVRTEVVCSRCGSHLGHVFDDGPNPTGLRYCMNSASLEFYK